MLMAVQEPYALMVQQDDILINPRELDEPLGTMVCFHRRYALGDHHDFADKDAFLQKLYLDTVGKTPEGEARYREQKQGGAMTTAIGGDEFPAIRAIHRNLQNQPWQAGCHDLYGL